jgi:hypothetical protein
LIEIEEKGISWEFKNPNGSNVWVKGDSYFSPLRYLLNGWEIRKKA